MSVPDTLILCPACTQPHRPVRLAPRQKARCVRCGTVLLKRAPYPLSRTLAFSLAALLLYIPANVYPILSIEKLGVYSENTLWQGVQTLFNGGYWGVALIVFLASIMIPLLKLAVMIYLVLARHHGGHARVKYWLYRVVHGIGPWSMLDVFLVAILVSLVKLGDLATVRAEAGLVAFAAVVILTLLASASFDPAVLWENGDKPATDGSDYNER